jgi:hypothetical protein
MQMEDDFAPQGDDFVQTATDIRKGEVRLVKVHAFLFLGFFLDAGAGIREKIKRRMMLLTLLFCFP